MNTEEFWSMIEKSRQLSEGNIDRQIRWLIDVLSELPLGEIQDSERILWTMMARAYRADLWEAASLVACGCTDDGFYEFQGWLIAQGQAIFEKVLKDPETLADIVDKKERLHIFDGRMPAIAEDAYERKTGQEMLEGGYSEPITLAGKPLTPASERPAKYPRITAKFGGCDDEELFN